MLYAIVECGLCHLNWQYLLVTQSPTKKKKKKKGTWKFTMNFGMFIIIAFFITVT